MKISQEQMISANIIVTKTAFATFLFLGVFEFAFAGGYTFLFFASVYLALFYFSRQKRWVKALFVVIICTAFVGFLFFLSGLLDSYLYSV